MLMILCHQGGYTAIFQNKGEKKRVQQRKEKREKVKVAKKEVENKERKLKLKRVEGRKEKINWLALGLGHVGDRFKGTRSNSVLISPSRTLGNP